MLQVWEEGKGAARAGEPSHLIRVAVWPQLDTAHSGPALMQWVQRDDKGHKSTVSGVPRGAGM